MRTESEPVTGQGDADPTTAEGVLQEFYRAFNGCDLALMERHWDGSGEASMDNPLGGVRRGWAEIRPTYAALFEGDARVQVEFHDYTRHDLGDGFVVVGRERGVAEAGGERIDLEIRTTRIFRRAGDRYRQLHHHGSIEDPALLARYRKAVLGA